MYCMLKAQDIAERTCALYVGYTFPDWIHIIDTPAPSHAVNGTHIVGAEHALKGPGGRGGGGGGGGGIGRLKLIFQNFG